MTVITITDKKQNVLTIAVIIINHSIIPVSCCDLGSKASSHQHEKVKNLLFCSFHFLLGRRYGEKLGLLWQPPLTSTLSKGGYFHHDHYSVQKIRIKIGQGETKIHFG